MSACPILAKEQYIKRHYTVCVELHFNICKKTEVKYESEHWYGRVPKWGERIHEGKVIMLWNLPVQTDRTIPNNKPDSIICDNEKGTCVLIDGAI
jgi:hypothetical protein